MLRQVKLRTAADARRPALRRLIRAAFTQGGSKMSSLRPLSRPRSAPP
jgi:hypothetical protein